jgi:hypothetical protein
MHGETVKLVYTDVGFAVGTGKGVARGRQKN